MTPKEEMEARIKEDGFDPENFTCRYVEEAVPDLPLDSSRPGDADLIIISCLLSPSQTGDVV